MPQAIPSQVGVPPFTLGQGEHDTPHVIGDLSSTHTPLQLCRPRGQPASVALAPPPPTTGEGGPVPSDASEFAGCETFEASPVSPLGAGWPPAPGLTGFISLSVVWRGVH